MDYPRVLVISNNGFSLSNSNGRTLGLLFKGWPKEKLAQFCFNTDGPLWEVCENYYCVSDEAALKSFLTFKPAKRDDFHSNVLSSKVSCGLIPRNALFSLARHIVWSIGRWQGKEFNSWLDRFNPQVVIIQSGDTAFPHDLARKIAGKYKAKLVFFNTEGIYFLNSNYLYKGPLDFVLFPIYRKLYRKAYCLAMQVASYAIYHHEMIKRDNDYVFNVPGCIVHTSTMLDHSSKPFNERRPVFSYFGNFAYGRDNALIEVGSFIKKVSPQFEINVYGRANNSQEEKLIHAEGLVYKGFVSYDEVINIMENSDVLLHVESQDEYFADNLRYGFSTKIADCLAIGKSFLVYSSPNIACAQYLKENSCAWVTSDEESFIQAIKEIISNSKKRQDVINKGLLVAKSNHSLTKNIKKFQNVLISIHNDIIDDIVSTPLVSIILPHYNCAKYIVETVNSIINQTYNNWELLIVDDCSTDEKAKQALLSLETRDTRIKFLCTRNNSGAGVARNIGLEHACGEYIAFCDADDWWYPEKLEKQMKFILSHGYRFTCTYYEDCDAELNVRSIVRQKSKQNLSDLISGCNIGSPGVVFQKAGVEDIRFPSVRRAEDWRMWLRLLSRIDYIYSYPEPLWKYRHIEGSTNSSKFKIVSAVTELYTDELNYSRFRAYLIFTFVFMPRFFWRKVLK